MRETRRFSPLLLTAAVVFTAAVALSAARSAAQPAERIEKGRTARVSGGLDVVSWAKLAADNRPLQVGVTVSYDLLRHPPAAPGSGPAGALAVVEFSQAVQDNTFLNHFELHWEKAGHLPEPFQVPHFDLHFFRIPAGQVARIAGPNLNPPSASRVPAGYIYLGAAGFTPQMGAHAVNLEDLRKPFTAVMVLGYYGGRMTFLEPMITREWLAKRKDVSLAVPMPQELGARTYFPTRFTAHYDPVIDSYQFILSHFVLSQR